MSIVDQFKRSESEWERTVRGSTGRTALDQITVSVTPSMTGTEAYWTALSGDATTPFTSPAWARSWYDARAGRAPSQPVIVVGTDGDRIPLFLMALARERVGPISVLRWPGDTHAAYHTGLFSPRCRELVHRGAGQAFWQKVKQALPDDDVLVGFGLPDFELDGYNPLALLPHIRGTCHSFRTALQGTWEDFYTAKCSAKLQRNDRRCLRRLQEQGPLEFVVAETADDRLFFMRTLLAQKGAHLRELGTHDFTADPGVSQFYEDLAVTPHWSNGDELYLGGLASRGTLLAVNLGVIHKDCFHGLILSRTQGEVRRFGPGRLLLMRTIEHLMALGMTQLDFGMGEDSFKSVWADRMVERRDVIWPLTTRGRVAAAAVKASLLAKPTIKSIPVLRNLASRSLRTLSC